MENRETNRVNMINATIEFSDAYPTPTSGISAYATALAAAKAKMVLVNSFNQIGGGSTKGVTIDTNVLRKTMTNIALKCANGTLGYANSTNNSTLKALVDYNEAKLNRLKKEDADDVCQAIHDATVANLAGAQNFGVTATDPTDLQAAIDIYRLATQNPRQAIITKSQANKQAREMVKEVMDNLLTGQMDVMVNTLKVSNRPHWNGYYQAREIVDLGSTSAKVRGTAVKVNDTPLANVVFTIYETGTSTQVKLVVTDGSGKFNASQIPPGDYDLRWELSGYMTVNETNVPIAAGKELKRKIVMKQGGGSVTLSGDVAAGTIGNVTVNGVNVAEETTVRLSVTGSALRFYAATGNMEPPGAQFLDVLAGQVIQKHIAEIKALLGFDEELEDFLNVQNNGTGTGHYELRFENLGV